MVCRRGQVQADTVSASVCLCEPFPVPSSTCPFPFIGQICITGVSAVVAVAAAKGNRAAKSSLDQAEPTAEAGEERLTTDGDKPCL